MDIYPVRKRILFFNLKKELTDGRLNLKTGRFNYNYFKNYNL